MPGLGPGTRSGVSAPGNGKRLDVTEGDDWERHRVGSVTESLLERKAHDEGFW